jgi:hypothetical protein
MTPEEAIVTIASIAFNMMNAHPVRSEDDSVTSALIRLDALRGHLDMTEAYLLEIKETTNLTGHGLDLARKNAWYHAAAFAANVLLTVAQHPYTAVTPLELTRGH